MNHQKSNFFCKKIFREMDWQKPGQKFKSPLVSNILFGFPTKKTNPGDEGK